MTSTAITTEQIAQQWLEKLGRALEHGHVDAIDELFPEDGYWRDFLALTWDIRTLHGTEKIKAVLAERWAETAFTGLKISEGMTAPCHSRAGARPPLHRGVLRLRDPPRAWARRDPAPAGRR